MNERMIWGAMKLDGAGSGSRTHGLQSHNLAL